MDIQYVTVKTVMNQWNLFINSLFAPFADLHVRKLATFADLHSYTHTYYSFVLLNETITIVSGSHCAHVLLISLAFWFFHTI